MNTYPEFVDAFAIVKVAAARANTPVGAMSRIVSPRSRRPTRRSGQGKYRDQFKVDWYQGGAGTSANMNANEVLANIGLELSGHQKGEYQYLRSARRPEHVAVDERLVSDRAQSRLPDAQRETDRRARKACGRVPRERQSVLGNPQDGSHGIAGRRPDDGGPGIPCLRRIAGSRDPAAERRGEIPLPGQHGRDRDRQRHQRASRLQSRRSRASSPASPASRL